MTTATLDRIAGCRGYSALVREYPPRVIRGRTEYRSAVRVIERLMSIDDPATDQLEFLELLSGLVEAYESRDFPTPAVPLKNQLAHLIEAKAVSQVEVARCAKVSPTTISDVLAGRRRLSIENMKRLARYFGIDPAAFLEAT